MLNKKKFLITTALKETFPKDNNEELVFLGEWCKTLKTRDIWQNKALKC